MVQATKAAGRQRPRFQSRSVTLTAHDGRVLYENRNYVYREQYQSTTDLPTFIQEDPAAIQRLSREFARQLVADILEGL